MPEQVGHHLNWRTTLYHFSPGLSLVTFTRILESEQAAGPYLRLRAPHIMRLLWFLPLASLVSSVSNTYPQCTLVFCLKPRVQIDDCAKRGNACACQSDVSLRDFASCIGTFCPFDLAKAYAAAQDACKENGNYIIPLKVDQWASAGSVLYPTPAAGFITASAPKPSVTEALVDGWFKKDTDCVRYVCLLPVAFMWIADPVRYPYPRYQDLCKSSDMLNQLAKCVGQYCPSDIAASYSTFSQGCSEAGVAMVVAFGQFIATASAMVSSTGPTSTVLASQASTSRLSTNVGKFDDFLI